MILQNSDSGAARSGDDEPGNVRGTGQSARLARQDVRRLRHPFGVNGVAALQECVLELVSGDRKCSMMGRAIDWASVRSYRTSIAESHTIASPVCWCRATSW